jgi:hypothetical protein
VAHAIADAHRLAEPPFIGAFRVSCARRRRPSHAPVTAAHRLLEFIQREPPFAPSNPQELTMMDRLFLATLTLGMLFAGSLTVVTALSDGALRAPMRVQVVQLEPVVVTAKRLAPPAKVAATAHLEPAPAQAQ